MTDEDWNRGYVKCLGMRLAGDLIGDVDERGEPIVDDTALILVNAHHEPIPFTLPETLEWTGLGMRTGHVQARRRTTRRCARATSSTCAIARWPSCSRGKRRKLKQPVSRAEVETLRREARRPEPPVPRHKPSAREA